MDSLSPARRSWNMSRIRGRDTKPEQLVRAALHRLGFRFRLKARRLVGRPDVVLTRHRVAVFVNGCFWHRHAGCGLAYTPKSNRSFWLAKFASNVRRDRTVRRTLRMQDWTPVTVWECETSDAKRLSRVLSTRLTKAVPVEAPGTGKSAI
jgi:DNA mismatch endonuclease (patch repair protein)